MSLRAVTLSGVEGEVEKQKMKNEIIIQHL